MLVASGKVSELPHERKLSLWHTARQANDTVVYGFNGTEDFRYPMCDAAGCATVVQKIHTMFPAEGPSFEMSGSSDLLSLSSQMCFQWRELADRRLPGSLEGDLARWLKSLRQELDGDVVLHFVRLPEERRVLVTASDVMKRLGVYYMQDEHGGARVVPEGSGLICAVSANGILSNYGPELVDLECRFPMHRGDLLTDNVRWRDLCKAAINDKSALTKVTGDNAYSATSLRHAFKKKFSSRKLSKGSIDSSMSLTSLNRPSGVSCESLDEPTRKPSIIVEPAIHSVPLARSPPCTPPLCPQHDSSLKSPNGRKPSLDRGLSNSSVTTSTSQNSPDPAPISPLALDAPPQHAHFATVMETVHSGSSRCESKPSMRKASKDTQFSGPSVEEQHRFLDLCERGDFTRAKELLGFNGDFVNVQPEGRWTALHYFAHLGNREAVELLLQRGADTSARTREGKTPYQVARGETVALLHRRIRAQRTRRPTWFQAIGCLCCPRGKKDSVQE